MKNATMSLLALALVLFTSATGDADQQTIQVIQGAPGGEVFPGGMQARPTKTGTGRIRGRLTTADTGGPVRRAQVRISGPDITPKTAVTDSEGRYEFRELPAGRFTLTATKSGFVTMSYGQTRPFESGKGIDLGEAQVQDKADITMPRGSVISGRILDEFGDPIADTMVNAMRSTWSNGKRRLQPTGRSAQTNDLGQYRIYGLPPGDYYVSATSQGGGFSEMVMIEAAASTFVRSTVGGPGPSGSEPRSGYAPTYYPGTANGAEAQKITLAPGQEMPSADFGLLPVRFSRVTGTVIGSDGRPVEGAMLNTLPRSSSEGTSMMMFPMGGSSARSDKNGQFTMNNVPPGDYLLQARGVQIMSSGSGGDTMMVTTRMGGGDGQSEFGSVPVTVGGEDVTNVVLVTSKGTSVSGRVVFEGGSRPSNTAPLRIMATSVDNDIPAGGSGSASLTADSTFEIKGLLGARMIRPTGLPSGWTLKAVTVNGTDVTDTGLDIKGGEPVSGVEIVLTSKVTEVNGAVTDAGRPAEDYTVVIFSDDPQKWTVPMNRHISSARPNQQGRFTVKNLPAGSYYAVAVEYIAQGDWNDPEVLERLKSKGTQFSVKEGEVKTLDLKLSGS